MRVLLYQSWDELLPLAGCWNQVLAASGSDSIFLTWEWCEAWWKNYGAGRPLFVLAAWEGSELQGVLPLYVDKARHWGAGWEVLRVVGDGSRDSDYLDGFIRIGFEREIARGFVDFLAGHRQQWDWLQIEGAAQGSPCVVSLSECARERGWNLASETIPCATLSLPKSWNDYLRVLQPRMRSKVRSSLARIEGQFGTAPSECVSPANIEEWLPELFDLHARRWQQSYKPGVFGDPAKRNFYRDISHRALAKGWLAFHRLAWSERALALQYGFRYRNRFYLLQEGYDPAFEDLRPGVVLRAWLMRHWIEEGLEQYDFLAGAAPHKLAWGAEQKLSSRTLLAAGATGAWVAVSGPRLYANFRGNIRQMVPRRLLSGRSKLLAWKTQRRWTASSQAAAPLSKRLMRWSVSRLYARTSLGAAARHLATHYTWQPTVAGNGSSRLQRRTSPVCTIFVYHRVNDERDPFFYAMPVSRFRAEMEYLAKNFRILSLDQLANGQVPSNGNKYCVAVTFDDGYRDNFLHAFPILQKLGIPANIFLTTGYIESGQLPWYDQVRLAFKLTKQPRIALGEIGGPDSTLDQDCPRLKALAHTLNWLRQTDEASRSKLLEELFRALRVSGPLNMPNTLLAWDEIRQMSRQGISFGAHTVTHPVLATLPVSRLQEEIVGSKKTVEKNLQRSIQHFAYPFGKKADFSSDAKQVVRAAGFLTAVTTISGVNEPEQDRYELKRFCLREPDMGMFGLKLDWYRMSGRATNQ
ncbi:MAG TPA: GNAT family N-acetyltransferase [Terriglobales bacterium]|nr:GNAT family N-acetyltransferase [Terriglobales bacterium]